jgi:hypothetical protein
VRVSFGAQVNDLMWRAENGGIPIGREEAEAKLKPVFVHSFGEGVCDAALNQVKSVVQKQADFEAAVREFVQLAKAAGIPVTGEIAAERLRGFFK